MEIKKIDHLVITTAQPEACVAFYGRLGFDCREAAGRYELFAGDFKMNVHIRGHELQPCAGHVQTGSADLCFEVEDVECFARMLEEAGIELELGLVGRTGVKGAMRSVYVRDPDGNLLEFSSYPQGV